MWFEATRKINLHNYKLIPTSNRWITQWSANNSTNKDNKPWPFTFEPSENEAKKNLTETNSSHNKNKQRSRYYLFQCSERNWTKKPPEIELLLLYHFGISFGDKEMGRVLKTKEWAAGKNAFIKAHNLSFNMG